MWRVSSDWGVGLFLRASHIIGWRDEVVGHVSQTVYPDDSGSLAGVVAYSRCGSEASGFGFRNGQAHARDTKQSETACVTTDRDIVPRALGGALAEALRAALRFERGAHVVTRRVVRLVGASGGVGERDVRLSGGLLAGVGQRALGVLGGPLGGHSGQQGGHRAGEALKRPCGLSGHAWRS